MRSPKRAHGRKLLIASIGVATVSYLGCTSDSNPPVSGNLMPPDAGQGGQNSTVSSSSSVSSSASSGMPPTSGNLVPPMPDASSQ